MKILSKNTSLLPPASMIPPFHILFTPLFHILPLFVLFHSFFTSLIYILLYFASFRFLLLHFATFRIHFAPFRFISYFSRTRQKQGRKTVYIISSFLLNVVVQDIINNHIQSFYKLLKYHLNTLFLHACSPKIILN